MTPRKIIIDTAPGQDDAIGLLTALASPTELEVLGITLVASRVPMDAVIHNAQRICDIAKRPDVGMHVGCDRPMRRPVTGLQRPDVDVGLDGYDAHAPLTNLRDEPAVDFLLRTLREAPDRSVTLCCFAPLTNIATLLERAPDVAPRIQEIVIMGGSHYELGDITPVAEANIWLDPEAARIVLQAGITCTLVPLDVAHKVIAGPERLAELREIGTEPARAVAAWADVLVRIYADTFGAPGMPLHAPCGIAFLLRPFLFTGRHVNVEVETDSDLTRGTSVVDWWGMTMRPPNALFLTEVDANGVFSVLTERIARL
ncbi:nucleoside hydrolase [Falsirhodobacter sp. 20TX0035]|uniref:nucleoside hydrolase n=1 Tax=Falsirhodobacter sp. 20TX0035 TaxID=3022019 RepID=UPI002330DE98|nr:nucleoside hydrolase [Falsirhodobacter sp. 20TX0035]MDB6453182.1 nucleoside hydrolase [Falsirhodobacter sp. 20TX0035]